MTYMVTTSGKTPLGSVPLIMAAVPQLITSAVSPHFGAESDLDSSSLTVVSMTPPPGRRRGSPPPPLPNQMWATVPTQPPEPHTRNQL